MKKILFIIVFLEFSYSWCFGAEQSRVTVIFSSAVAPYQRAWEGLKNYLNENKVSLRVSEHNLEKENPAHIIQQILRTNPDLVVTIGPEASMLAKEKIKNIPVVFSMVLHPRDFAGSNLTGVSLEIPFRMKLEKIKRILPHIKKIGVIYSSRSTPVYKEILQECKEMGIQLVVREIDSVKEFPDAFKDISWQRQLDLFLMIPDTKIYFLKSIEYLLIEGLKNKVPVIGLSSSYTRAGALISFEADYSDLGRQAGEIALKIFEGEKPANIKPSRPERINISLNLMVAERLDIKIHPQAIKEAGEVFRK
jgi:putative ABC transport system substrate-binding protein